ncbi:hypothetical protein RUM43_005415 [Polyplax serrata]|uniref:Uncharacterized protein n=1 Tax=Polyplax serrata TaxID=468196 RepID=A0AAN8PDI1_POLSC
MKTGRKTTQFEEGHADDDDDVRRRMMNPRIPRMLDWETFIKGFFICYINARSRHGTSGTKKDVTERKRQKKGSHVKFELNGMKKVPTPKLASSN